LVVEEEEEEVGKKEKGKRWILIGRDQRKNKK
jgi:hypothetical protein